MRHKTAGFKSCPSILWFALPFFLSIFVIKGVFKVLAIVSGRT